MIESALKPPEPRAPGAIESEIADRVDDKLWRLIHRRVGSRLQDDLQVQDQTLGRMVGRWFQVRNGVEDHLRQEVDTW